MRGWSFLVSLENLSDFLCHRKLCFLLVLGIFLISFAPGVLATHIIDGDALIAYMEGASTPRYRTWNGTANSSESNAQDVGDNDPDWVEIATSFTNFTAVMAVLDSASDVNVQVWNGSWSNNLEVTASSRAGDHSFDVAYENNSDTALVVYNNRQTTPKYRIWNGTGWGAENSAQDVGSEPEDLRLKSNRKRREIILITREADSSVDVQVWNGTTWNNQTQLSTTSIADDTPIAIAYETLSGDGIVVWGNNNDDTPNYVVWNGTGFSSSANALSIGGGTQEPMYIELATHPYSDNITMMTIDDQSDVNVQVWNGTDWTNQVEITTSACNTAFCADITFEQRNNRSIVVYADGTNIPKYRTWNGTNWSTEASVANIGAVPVEIDLTSHPNKNETILLVQEDSGNVHFFVWNVTNWTARGVVGTGLNQNNRKAISAAYVVPFDDPPLIDSISESSDPIKGGTTITITPNSVSDINNGTLILYCDSTNTSNSTNTDCTGGTTSDSISPYSLTCTFTVTSDDTNYTEYCRAYDQIGYSHAVNLTYTTDSTVPTTLILNVSGDTSATYVDSVDDGFTNITVSGESGMVCRFGTSDAVYSSMSSANECTIIGSRAICPATPSQGVPDFYVSCNDSVGNGQSTSQNLDVTDLLVDWTKPTTSDDSVSDIKTPTYTVTITEADNVDSDPDTQFCRDTTNACTPTTTIDSGGQISFNTTHRGTNYLRYNSSDDAGNRQSTQSKTININRLPTLTSASANLSGNIIGGATINISTVSNESDSGLGQTLYMFVCNETGANGSGCTSGATLCSNVTNSSTNTYCVFNAQSDSATHSWFVYMFDDSAEGASNNPLSGTYTTDSTLPVITILDPGNVTYTQDSVTAQIALNEGGANASYSLDGAANVSMTRVSSTLFSATLSGLANQLHNITFYANDTVGNLNVSSVRYFTVDTTASDTLGPSIVVLSPANNSYHSSAVLLNISLSENGYNASYSLDGAANVSLGNVSLTLWNASITPSESTHTIIFYANDTSSNRNTGASSIITFTYDVTPPRYTSASFTPTSVNDSANVTCYASWTDNVNLSIAVVSENSTGSFVNHTFLLSQTSNTSNYTIDETNLTPGTVGCRFFTNDSTGNLNSTSIAFAVSDATNPSITNISTSPSAEADLDPNVRINITANVTDNFNLTTIILQFKQHNETSFTNFSMSNSTPQIYSGNFTPDRNNNWTYRIFAQDLAGNQNYSSDTNLSVQTDKTWSFTDTISETTSIVRTDNRVINLGNITINNTGDVPLQFNISSNVSWVTINGTSNNSAVVNLSSGGVALNISNITANTTGFDVGLFAFKITIAANESDSSPSSNSTNLQVNIQNTAGPFLSVSIDTFTSSVSKGQSGVSYAASVSNLGTSDASGVWLAWTLPSEFSLASGSLNRSIGNLIIGGSSTNTISIDVSSSSSDKNVTINASSMASDGSSDNESKTVTIGNPTTTTTTQVGGGGGGGGTGGGGGGGGLIDKILSGEEILSSSETFELVRGESSSFPITVKNIFEKTSMEGVSIKIEGYLSKYMTIHPQVISKVDYNESRQFTVSIISPEYMERGQHELTITIIGKIKGKNIDKELKDTRKVLLIIHTIGKDEASRILDLAISSVKDMESAGFPIAKISRLLEEAKNALVKHYFDNVKDLFGNIKEMKEAAFKANDLIKSIKNKIFGYKFLTGSVIGGGSKRFSRTEDLLNLAQAAFEREDYQTALQRANEAQLALAIETKDLGFIIFLVKYWWAILIFLISLTVGGVFGYKKYMEITISWRIRELEREEDSVGELIRETQKKYFKEKSIGPDTFNRAVFGYHRRISKIRKLLTKLMHKRIRILRPERVIKDLEEEKRTVVRQIENLQKDYFVNRKISENEYNRQIKVYNQRLAEIEDERLTLRNSLFRSKKIKAVQNKDGK